MECVRHTLPWCINTKIYFYRLKTVRQFCHLFIHPKKCLQKHTLNNIDFSIDFNSKKGVKSLMNKKHMKRNNSEKCNEHPFNNVKFRPNQKCNTSESKRVQASPSESKWVRSRICFLVELNSLLVVEAKASPSESKWALMSPSELDYKCLFWMS
jgi:hypothetical protein